MSAKAGQLLEGMLPLPVGMSRSAKALHGRTSRRVPLAAARLGATAAPRSGRPTTDSVRAPIEERRDRHKRKRSHHPPSSA